MRLSSVFIAAFIGCSFSVQCLFAQISDEVLEDFRVAKSVGIGLTGVVTSTHLSVADEMGVAYDTVSLLRRPDLRDMVGVSEEGFAAMSQTRADLVTEIESMVVSAVYSDEYRDRIRARFFEVEDELRGQLSEEQLASLKMARVKVGFEQNGTKYLSVPSVAKSLGLSESSAKKFEDSVGFSESIESKKLELLKSANEELISQLGDAERKLFENIVKDKALKTFLKAPLFVEQKEDRHKTSGLDSKRRSILKRKYIQRKLDLNSDQIAKIKLDKQGTGSPAEFLRDEQLQEIDRMAITPEFKNRGTVTSLTSGLLSEKLELDKTRSEELCKFGNELNAKLKSDVAKAANQLLVEQFDVTVDTAAEISGLLLR